MMAAAVVVGVVGGLAVAWLVWGMCAAASRADELSERMLDELKKGSKT